MNGTAAARLSVIRKAEERGRAQGPTGSDGLSGDGNDLLSRAAMFRIEADALRIRAGATDEAVVRTQYFKLADHWSSLAAGLESQVLALVTESE